jgi:hypothetical protein
LTGFLKGHFYTNLVVTLFRRAITVPKRKPFFQPRWVRYEVSELIQRHIDSWQDHCRHRDRLQDGPLRDSASGMYRKNPETPRLETTRELLDIALRATGPVAFKGQLYKSSDSIYRGTDPADDSVQKAEELFVEIHSPLNGMGRRCQ